MATRKKNIDMEMSFYEHLDELRKRLIIIAIIIFVAALACFAFIDDIIFFLTSKAENLNLIYTTPAEAFMSQIRLSFLSGSLLTLPFTLYQVLAFIMPALRKKEKKAAILLLFFMVILFYTGLLFAYYVVFPYALFFFLGFSTEGLLPLFTISSYISFVASFLIGFGLVFQVPLIFWFLGRLSIVSSAFLRTNRKYALLIIAIISAVITPPDLFSMLLMMGPLLLLYEIGILLVRLTERRKLRYGG
jgi:sec-independent protein translocase protein TatC